MRKKLIYGCLIICLFSLSVHGADIYLAIESGELEQVVSILEQNPDIIDKKNADGLTPLNLAAYKGQSGIVRRLLEMGADASIGDNENSQPIHNASVAGHNDVIEELLNHGVDINVQDNNGMTALIFSISYQWTETARYLLDKDADVHISNNIGRTPLNYAIWQNQLEIAELLLQSGIIVDEVLSNPFTPVTWAIRNGDKPMVEMFISNGANIQRKTPQGESYLHHAVFFEKLDLVEYFIDNGIDVNVVKRGNLTPLHIAATVGYYDIADFLINRGADLNVKSTDGGTPLHFARATRNQDIADLLKSKGAEDSPRDFPLYQGKYLGAHKPGDDPKPFVPELFLDIYRTHSAPAFSPDGKEVYWEAIFMRGVNNASRVWCMKEKDGRWQAPRVASFAEYPSGGPVFTHDGKRLYYVSFRPRENDSGLANDLDIWFVERKENDWNDPIHLGPPVNADGTNEVYPFVSTDGSIYLNKGPQGYVKYSYVGGTFNNPDTIGDFFDTDYIDNNSTLEYFIFFSDRNKERFHYELFVSYHKPDGAWSKPVYMGDRLHQGVRATLGRVSTDDKYLFYIRDFSFYWIDASIIHDLKPNDIE